MAVTAEHIMLIDDRRSTVSLPELPLLAVLPGTGGLTRLTDKRRVRRDLADVFCTTEEGVRGKRAVEWRLVDEVVPPSAWEAQGDGARAGTGRTIGPAGERGVALTPLQRTISAMPCRIRIVQVAIDRRAAALRSLSAGRRTCPGTCAASTTRALRSGRWRWRGNWTMRCCICV